MKKLTREELRAAAESAGCELVLAIEKLKKESAGSTVSMPVEFYLLDNAYDVHIMVLLVPKKPQRYLLP